MSLQAVRFHRDHPAVGGVDQGELSWAGAPRHPLDGLREVQLSGRCRRGGGAGQEAVDGGQLGVGEAAGQGVLWPRASRSR